MSTHDRRLEDRIRKLCTKAIAAKDSDRLEPVLIELQAAIHQAVEKIRSSAGAHLKGRCEPPPERRKSLPG
jgi:hypothetical protein